MCLDQMTPPSKCHRGRLLASAPILEPTFVLNAAIRRPDSNEDGTSVPMSTNESRQLASLATYLNYGRDGGRSGASYNRDEDGSSLSRGNAHPIYLDAQLCERFGRWVRSSISPATSNCDGPLPGNWSFAQLLNIVVNTLANIMPRAKSEMQSGPPGGWLNQTSPAINNQLDTTRRSKLIKALARARLINSIFLVGQLIILIKLFTDRQYYSMIVDCSNRCTLRFHDSPRHQSVAATRQINAESTMATVMMMSKRLNYGTIATQKSATSCERSHIQGRGQSTIQRVSRVFESITDGPMEVCADAHALARTWNLRPAGRNIYHYLLIVALMDFLSNLNWHYHRRRALFKSEQGSQHGESRRGNILWPIKAIRQLTRFGGHLFQFAQAMGLYIALGSRPAGCLALSVCFLNYSNRVAALTVRLRRLNLRLNSLLQTGEHDHTAQDHDANHLAAWPVISVQDTYEAGNNDGRLMSRGRRLSAMRRHTLEGRGTIGKYLLMGQMAELKLSLVTLFMHLDDSSQSMAGTIGWTPLEMAILVYCIIQSMCAMYAQYDKYYTSYTNQ